MSDIFSFNGDDENPKQQFNHAQSESEFWRQKNERRQQLNEEYQQDLDRYSVNISQEDYNIIKDAIANAEVPEDEAYRWACAMELNKQYDMPVAYAYQNLEQINAAKWGDRFTFTPKTNFKAIVDSGRLGANTLKMGRLGSKIMKAQMFGKTEYNNYLAGKVESLDDMMAEYEALEQESEALTDLEDRNLAIEALKFAAQSAPYTGYVAGVGLLGGLLSGGAGTAAAFAVSMDNAAGLEYMRLRKAGSDVGDAAGFAILSGGLQALVETSLGNVAGALGKKSLGDLASQAVKNKITGNVFKRLAYNGTFKTLALRMGKEWLKENAEEGLEEVIQDLIEKGTDALAAELGGYEIEGLDAKAIARDAWENFKGGVMGSLILGLPTSAIKGKADIKEFVNVRRLAEVTPSQETFNKFTEDSSLWEGMSDEEKKNAQKTTWENAQARVEAAAETEARKIAEGRDAAEGAEEAPAENEDGTTEANPVARDERGRLYTSDDVSTDDAGNVTGGTFVVGDKTKSENNRYGYIKYSQDAEGNITIDNFKMTEGRDKLRAEAFDEFARQHPDVNIEWNATAPDLQDFKNELIDANPSGKKNGLNYYSTTDLDNVAARKRVAEEIRKNIHNVKRNADGSYTQTELSNKQVAAAVTLIESAARRMGMGLNEYVNKTFGNQIFGSREEFASASLAQGEDVNKKAGGMYQGVAQANWREVGQQVKAVIYAGEHADFSTWAHEMAHVFQNQLDGQLKADAEAAFNVQGGDWINSTYTFKDGRTMSSAEAFAYGFQDWLETGKAENEQMRNIFQKFAEFIADCYNRLKKHLDFTPEIESVFNQLLDGDDTIMSKALKAAQEQDNEYRASLKRQAEEKQAAKEAAAEKAKKQAEAEREEASEGTEFAEAAPTAEELLNGIEEAENETKETTEETNAIDNALENTNLTDEQKEQIAETLKDESSTIVEKAEATTEAAESAYDENAPYDLFQNEGALLSQLIGEPAIRRMAESEERTRILLDLKLAQDMKASGKDTEAIRRATGWENINNEWKLETDDSIIDVLDKANINKNLNANPDQLITDYGSTRRNLDKVLDAPELFKYYPILKNVRVSFYKAYDAQRSRLSEDGILLNTTLLDKVTGPESIKSSLVYEVQKLIHALEHNKTKSAVGENIDEYIAAADALDREMRKAIRNKNAGLDYDKAAIQERINDIMSKRGDEEARIVASRVLLDANQRKRKTLAQSKEEVQGKLLSQEENPDFLEATKKAQDLLFQNELTMYGIHNLSEEALRHAVKMGGLANPSMAVVDTEKNSFTNFGEVSLIPYNYMLEKGEGSKGTFGADIYSPRYPSIDKRVTETGQKKVHTIFHAIEDENYKNQLEEKLVNKIENSSKQFDYAYSPLVMAYLAEKGNKDFYKYEKSEYSDEVKDLIKSLGASPNAMAAEDNKVILEAYSKHLKKDYEAQIKAKQEDLEAHPEYSTFNKNVRLKNIEKLQEDLDIANETIKELVDEKTGLFNGNVADDFLYRVRHEIESAGKIDYSASEYAARELIENDPDFLPWAKEAYDRIEKEERIFNGFTPSGNRRYLAHTLENVSKYMRQQELQGGESFYYGLGSTRAKFTPNFTTLKQIKKARDRLVTSEEFEKIKEEYNERFDKITEALGDKYDPDVGAARFEEAFEYGKSDPIGYIEKEYGISVDDDMAQEILDFATALRVMPTEYFETKFTRPVELNEFAGAIIPSNLSQDLKDTLAEKGLMIEEYDREAGNREEVTKAALQKFNETRRVLFQEEVEEVRQQYENTDQWMKAPNGKDTNLYEYQWLLTRTPSFKKWFEESRIVDENGDPKVMYHGTPLSRSKTTKNKGWAKDENGNDIYIRQEMPFNTFRGGNYNGLIFFTPDYDKAKAIADERSLHIPDNAEGKEEWTEEGYVFDTYLKANKPYNVSEVKDFNAILDKIGNIKAYDYYLNKLHDITKEEAIKILQGNNSWRVAETPDFLNAIRELGYDALQAKDDGILYTAVFNPNQIKSAWANNGNFDPANPNILFQNIGEYGAENLDEAEGGTTRLDNLRTAKKMEEAGKDAKNIRLATAWEKGDDGKWRYELDDSKIKVENDFYPDKYFLNKYPRLKELEEKLRKDITAYNNFTDEERNDYDYYSSLLSKFVRNHIDFTDGKQIWKEPVELNDVMEAPELFKAYPQLEKVKFIVKNLEAGTQGQYDADTDTITLSPMAGKSTLLHEVQHAIQEIEGFAKGGSERQFDEISAEPLREKVSDLNKKMSEVLTEYVPLEDWLAIDQKLLEQNLSPEEYVQARIDAISKYDNGEYRKLAEEQQEIISRIEEIEENALEGQVEIDGRTYADAYEAYRSLAGEVEARNVQTRMSFTPEQRLKTLLRETEDVAPEDKIILFQEVYHGSGADFDKFDTENFGLSGEGSMSFGYGVYLTDNEDIAKDYARRQAETVITLNGKEWKPDESKLHEKIIYGNLKNGWTLDDVKKWAEGVKAAGRKSLVLETIKEFEEKGLKIERDKRKVYTVEIPDDGYLNWEERVSLDTTQQIVEELKKQHDELVSYSGKLRNEDLLTFEGITGSGVYSGVKLILGGSDKAASQFLHSIGYAGIKYPAGTIHGNGNGAYNYVIFNDDDAQIVDKLLFQTNAELMDEARGFDSWQDFMEYCETFHADDEVSPIPSDADAQWYQTFYETAKGIKTEQEKNEEALKATAKKETQLPAAVDALFTTMIASDPEMVDSFLQAVADIDAIDLDSVEWQQADNAEDAAQRDKIEQLKDFINITLSDYNWQTALRRIQGGHEISEGLRKRLIGEMTDNFKARDFRALYAEVMGDEQYAVAPEDSITAVLNKKLKKYHDIVKPNDDVARWSPERRKQLAEQLANRELADKIRRGDLKLDDELDAYIKSLNKQIKESQKQFNELESETKADYQRIADKEKRDLLKLHEQLLIARSKLKSRNAEINRKIAKGLKVTEKYKYSTQNLNADYNEIFRKYEDLRNSITINAEVQAALDRQEKIAGLKEDLNAKQKEKNLTAEVKKMRIQLVKRTMRRVPFNRVDYNNARTVIAIQRMLEPNLLGGVNRFIGIDSPYLRGVISQIVTDSDYKESIMAYLNKNSKASQAFADFKKKLTELKSIKDFDSWTAKDRKAAIRYLPKENWIRDLKLKELAKEREESIDLDIGMEEVKRTVYDEKTGEPKTYKDKEGNEHNVTETAFRLKYDDEIGRLVQDAVGADMFDKIVNMPFSEWTTEDLETLAQRIDELYTEGRDLKAAKDEARKKEAAAIRKRIEDAIKETGITINDDDTPEEKERKQKQIDKILGMSDDLKGTEAAKPKGFKAKITRLLHSYADMNVLRFARMLDGQREGENVRMLYRKEDDCYNAKQRSMNARAEKIYKVMQENGITEGDLAETVEFNTIGSKTEFTVDELLYFLAADKDYAEDEKLLAKGEIGLDANDDYAATSRNAVMFGNMMSDMMSQEEKESWLQLDKDMEEALQNDTLTQEQKEQQAAGQLDKKPGTTRYIAACHAKWNAILGLANNYLSTHPELKALMEAIEADYAEQYDRMNEVSINEFNMPVHRVKAYVPLVRRESNGDTNENQVKEDLLGAAGVGKQWADRGMTQRRVNISPLNQKPVQTGLFRTWADSIERTEHFIAYAPYVRQLNAIYKSRDASYTRRFIESRYGASAIKYLDEYINEVANPNAGRIRERGAEWLHVLRGKTAPAYLGWKASAIIKQGLTSPWPYMQFVNPAEYVSAAMKFTFNPEMREAIKEKSVFMKMRRMDPVNDLIDEMADNAKTKLDRGWSNFSKLGMQGLELIDWACVAPGWLACYEKKYNQLQNASNARYEAKMAELKERNMYADIGTSEYLSPQQMDAEAKKEMLEDIEAEAVRYADDCTRACQPSNRVTDLAPLFKNSSEAMKAFLQFQTSLNVIWQNIRYDMPYAVKNKEFTRIAGTVIGYVCAGIFMNSVMEGIGGDDDDDEKQALRNLIYYSTTQFTDSIPIMGSEITNTMDQLITGKRGFYGSGTDMTPSATKLLSVLTNAKKGNWQKAAELTAEGIGLYLGAPVSGAKEINKLLGKPLNNGDVNLVRGISDVYGIAGDILEE